MTAKERKRLEALADKMIADSISWRKVTGLKLVLRAHAQNLRRAIRKGKVRK